MHFSGYYEPGSAMRRNFVAAVAVATVLASSVNPHFVDGGAYDAYGFAPWWQSTGARLCLSALVVAAIMLWRRSAKRGLTILACEFFLYLSLAAGSISSVGMGHFSNGWGGSFLVSFYIAVALRVLLLYLAYRQVRARPAEPGVAADEGPG